MHVDTPLCVVQIPPVALHSLQYVPPEPPVPTHRPLWQIIELGHVPHVTHPPQSFDHWPHSVPSVSHVLGTQHVPFDCHVPVPSHDCPTQEGVPTVVGLSQTCPPHGEPVHAKNVSDAGL
jgi:hypothetical protein